MTLHPTVKNRLTRCVNALLKYLELSEESERYDASFDGGEWSGPAHAELRRKHCLMIIREHNFRNPGHFISTLERRVSSKWIMKMGLNQF